MKATLGRLVPAIGCVVALVYFLYLERCASGTPAEYVWLVLAIVAGAVGVAIAASALREETKVRKR